MIYFALGLIVGITGTYLAMRGRANTKTKESAKETEIKVPATPFSTLNLNLKS